MRPNEIIRAACTAIAIAGVMPAYICGKSDDRWIGKSGGDLMREVALTHSPKSYFTLFDGEEGIFESLKITDGNQDGTAYMNYFSSDELPYGKNGGPPSNLELLCIASPEWWKITSQNYIDAGYDLLNMIPAPSGVRMIIGNCAPGSVTTAEYGNGIWCMGRGAVGPQEVRLWEPPEVLKGDVARILMYMACVYPDGILRYESCGGVVWGMTQEDGFTNAYAGQLMSWHRADPPSEYETRRNEVLGKLQGNANPFVEFPMLAEYLWGNHKGEAYANAMVPPVEVLPTLRGVYSVDEPYIYLNLDGIPDNAIWEIDGKIVEGEYLVPAKIGTGIHELRFDSGTLKGMVKIEIR